MKNTIGFILFGLIFQYGIADLSHIQNNVRNGYLPPNNDNAVAIQQEYERIKSLGFHTNNEERRRDLPLLRQQDQPHINHNQDYKQNEYNHQQSSENQNNIREYLPPHPQEHHSILQQHNHHEDHQHNQRNHIEENRSYLPTANNQNEENREYLPPHHHQNQAQNSNQYHDEKSNSYSPPVQQLVQTEINQNHSPENNRGYLPPHQHNDMHQSDHHDNLRENREYSPPHQEHNNAQISQNQYGEENRGYLPPHQHEDQLQVLSNNAHHDHSEQNLGYLPPLQEPTHNQINQNHEASRGYLPPSQQQDQQQGYQNIPHQDHVEKSREYLPPQQQIPDLQIHQNQHHEENRDYLPPYQDQSQHQNSNNQNHYYHHDSYPSHQNSGSQNQFHLNQLSELEKSLSGNPGFQIIPSKELKLSEIGFNNNQENGYLPPDVGSQIEQTHNKDGSISNQELSLLNFNNIGDNHYLPPPKPSQSHDNLHIKTPIQLGLPLEQLRTQSKESDHINVPLPVPQVGYFFFPGVVSQLSNFDEQLQYNYNSPQEQSSHVSSAPIEPANLPEAEALLAPPKYSSQSEAFNSQPQRETTSQIVIIPSVQTAQDRANQGIPPNFIISDYAEHQQDLPNHVQTYYTNFAYPGTSEANSFSSQQHSNHINQDNYHNVPSPGYQDLNLQGGNTYNAPTNEEQFQLNQYYNNNADEGSQANNHNQVTHLLTYMNTVQPGDRYGSSQYQRPPSNEISQSYSQPTMFREPSVMKAYAPDMAYSVSNNIPSSASYLPPVQKVLPQVNQQEYSSNIGFDLNEEAKRNIAQAMLMETGTIFPLDELFGNDIDTPLLMSQLSGRNRIIQVMNTHDNSVRNFRIHQSTDHDGVGTIEVLGPTNEAPTGEHKLIRVVGNGSNSKSILQTIKIFTDNSDVPQVKQNTYLPPSHESQESKIHEKRRNSHRNH